MKVCNKCSESKNLSEFGTLLPQKDDSVNYRSSAKTIKHRNTCKLCEAERAREFRKTYRLKHGKGYKGTNKLKDVSIEDRYLMSVLRTKIAQSKVNNRRLGRPFNIDADYLYQMVKLQNNRCVYTNELFVLEKYHNGNLSVDKIIPELGYIKGNIQLVCWAVNRAKGDLSHDTFINMCKIITERATTIPQGSTA